MTATSILEAIGDEVSAHLITPDEMTFFMAANQRKLDFSCVEFVA